MAMVFPRPCSRRRSSVGASNRKNPTTMRSDTKKKIALTMVSLFKRVSKREGRSFCSKKRRSELPVDTELKKDEDLIISDNTRHQATVSTSTADDHKSITSSTSVISDVTTDGDPCQPSWKSSKSSNEQSLLGTEISINSHSSSVITDDSSKYSHQLSPSESGSLLPYSSYYWKKNNNVLDIIEKNQWLVHDPSFSSSDPAAVAASPAASPTGGLLCVHQPPPPLPSPSSNTADVALQGRLEAYRLLEEMQGADHPEMILSRKYLIKASLKSSPPASSL